MAWAYVASALGVIISVTGGLFLRRLLGEVAELRRQITGIDREMRAQRARVKFLRYLMEQDDERENDEDLPEEAAVANGGLEPPPDAAVDKSRSPEPARRKKHLGLYLGGAVAVLATVSHAARQAVRDHYGQAIGTATGVAVTAATVTMVTIQPWTNDASNEPPSSAPTAAPSPTYWPPPPIAPPQPTTTGGEPTASPSPSTTEPEPSPSVSVSLTPSESAPPSPAATSSVVPIVDESPPATQPEGTAPSDGDAREDEIPAGEPDGQSSPTASPAPPPSAEPPPDEAPPSAAPAEYALCVSADVAPLPDAEACVLVTVRGAPNARRGAPTPAPRSGGPARA